VCSDFDLFEEIGENQPLIDCKIEIQDKFIKLVLSFVLAILCEF
jgi:hypothetical protein